MHSKMMSDTCGEPAVTENDWRENLGSMLNRAEAGKIEAQGSDLSRFIDDVALPAYEELTIELERYGRSVNIRSSTSAATLSVTLDGEEEISYRLQGRTFPTGIRPFAEVRFRERKGLRIIRVESMLRSGSSDYVVSDVSGSEIIANFMEHYGRVMQSES